ncbi:hypothetical protein [Alicyclobacillus fodiniaquatilis]|uniref:Uncharacterized protein n=1 Tax=Alicyclobacillus fodiniaquatilis TaxID=1661150 RepID=A0ABW4JFR2_9BACL
MSKSEIEKLAHQVQQLQLVLEDMQQTLERLQPTDSYGGRYAHLNSPRQRLVSALEDTVPRQSEYAEYARSEHRGN